MTGAELIAKERQKQLEADRWPAGHDDRYTGYELIRAALCYAMPPEFRHEAPKREGLDGWESCPMREAQYFVPDDFPFHPSDWNPTPGDRLRELARAGSLIAAEMDRLIRKGPA